MGWGATISTGQGSTSPSDAATQNALSQTANGNFSNESNSAWNYLNQQQQLQQQAAQQAAQLKAQQDAQSQAASLANTYMNQWNTHIGEVQSMMGDANTSIDNAMTQAGHLGDVANTVLGSAQHYQTELDPMIQGLATQAAQESGVRTGLMGNLQTLATPDLEGAAGRAAGDVSQQADTARQNTARSLAQRGIYGGAQQDAATEQGFMQEALGRTGAENSARIGEQNRAGQYILGGLQYIDPSKTATAAAGAASVGGNLMNEYGTLSTNQSQLLGSLAGLKGTLASQYGQEVAEPVGQLGASLLGRSIGLNAGGGSSTSSGTGSSFSLN